MDTNTPEETPADVIVIKKPRFSVEKVKQTAKKVALAGGILVAGIAVGRATSDISVDVDVEVSKDDES